MLLLRKNKKKRDDRWKADGQQKFQQFSVAFANVNHHLRPFHFKRTFLIELLEIAHKINERDNHHNDDNADNDRRKRVWCFSRLMLEEIKPMTKWAKNKSHLWRRKYSILRQFSHPRRAIYSASNSHPSFIGPFRPFDDTKEPSTPSETKFFQVIENAYYRKVPIRASSLMHLRLAIQDYEDASIRFKTIQANIAACLFIPRCEHILHKRPSGCPQCGVVHIGGVTGGVQFVRSIDKTSGVPTLVKLEFELETLRAEEIEQDKLVKERKALVDSTRHEVFMTLLVNFQAWFAARHAHRISRRLEALLEHSQFYFRIRRLVRMKREIDGTLTSSIDINELYYRYSELTVEVEEYVALKKKNLDILILRMSRLLVSKLRTMVLKTRRYRQRKLDLERTLLRMTEGNAEKRQREKAIRVMRKRVERMAQQKFICFRVECNNRHFLSEDRYTTHMNIHKQQDLEKQGMIEAERLNAELMHTHEFEQRQLRAQSIESAFSRIQETHSALSILSTAWQIEESKAASTEFAVVTEASALPHIRALAPPSSYLYHMELLSRSELVTLKPGNNIQLDRPVMKIGTQSSCEICAVLARQASAPPSRVSTAKTEAYILPKLVSATSDFGEKITSSSTESTSELLVDIDVDRGRAESRSHLSTGLSTPTAAHIPNIARVHCMLYADLTSGKLNHDQPRLTVVDNNTSSGTYVISSQAKGMALRVPTKASAGYILQPGDLLCIGLGDAESAKSSRLPPPVLSAIEASSAAIVFRIRCADIEKAHK